MWFDSVDLGNFCFSQKLRCGILFRPATGRRNPGYAPPIFFDGIKDCVRRHDHGRRESSPLPPVLSEAESTGIDAGQIRHAPESAIPVRVAQTQIKILPLPAPNAENRNLDWQFPARTKSGFFLYRARHILFCQDKKECGALAWNAYLIFNSLAMSSEQSPHRLSRPIGQAALRFLAPPLPIKPAVAGL